MKTSLLLIGGFLGAGKTTLVAEMAQRLQARGEKVVVITNDQGNDLIDTEMMTTKGIPAAEITGGCFCCKFEDLQGTIKKAMEQYNPTWILAEAVGSCTDLVATVIRPMKRLHGEDIRVVPISIAVDPERADLLLEEHNPFPYEVGYLFAQQIQEADIVLINKSDRVSPELIERIEGKLKQINETAQLIRTSAVEGSGLEDWLASVDNGVEATGEAWLSTIDYDVYATAEAHLGWLNSSVKLSASDAFELATVVKTLGSNLRQTFLEKGFEAAHAKLMGTTDTQAVKGSLTTSQRDWEWFVKNEETVQEANLLINARVCADPDELKNVVIEAVHAVSAQFGITAEISHMESFKPGRPNPTHRDVVTA